jgi:hypothetical protein
MILAGLWGFLSRLIEKIGLNEQREDSCRQGAQRLHSIEHCDVFLQGHT